MRRPTSVAGYPRLIISYGESPVVIEFAHLIKFSAAGRLAAHAGLTHASVALLFLGIMWFRRMFSPGGRDPAPETCLEGHDLFGKHT